MKIDFTPTINDLKGKPIKEGDAEDSPVATLGSICITALMAQFEDERTLPAKEKVSRFKLAQKLVDAKELELKVEEVNLLKTLVGKAFGALIVGRAEELLDPGE